MPKIAAITGIADLQPDLPGELAERHLDPDETRAGAASAVFSSLLPRAGAEPREPAGGGALALHAQLR
jgi:hypothetical protein